MGIVSAGSLRAFQLSPLVNFIFRPLKAPITTINQLSFHVKFTQTGLGTIFA